MLAHQWGQESPPAIDLFNELVIAWRQDSQYSQLLGYVTIMYGV